MVGTLHPISVFEITTQGDLGEDPRSTHWVDFFGIMILTQMRHGKFEPDKAHYLDWLFLIRLFLIPI